MELLLVLALLLGAIVMFVQGKPRMDAVAVIMIAALPFTGIITIGEALIGFSDPNIVLIAVLFVLGEGLVRTGVARSIGDWINGRSKGSETKLLLMLMLSVGLLGSVMSSTAIVAIFIPIVFRICANTGIPPSRLMMPMSFAALISGMMTLISTAPNLVVNSELQRQGHAGFDFFSITPFGTSILILGAAYMLFARKWLPGPNEDDATTAKKPTFGDWIDKYELAGREFRVQIRPHSPLVGQEVSAVDLKDEGIKLLAVERRAGKKVQYFRPSKIIPFEAGDVLLLDVRAEPQTVDRLVHKYNVEVLNLEASRDYLTNLGQEMGMTEAIVPSESRYAGRTVREARLQSDTGLTVVGLWRGNEVIVDGFLEEELRVGDTLLLAGFWEDVKHIQQASKDLVLLHLPAEYDEVLPAPSKAPHAVAILVITVLLMVSGVLENVHAVILGCLAMGLFGIVDMASAYRAISWKSLVLIVGMLPFSIALQRTGGVELAADGLMALLGDSAPWVTIGVLFLVTAVLGLFISNTATAVLMAPIAIAMAYELGVSPYPLAMAVTLAASSAFMTPVSSPVNTLVVAPGGYSFGDFLKMGVPFTLIVWLLSMLMIPWILPF